MDKIGKITIAVVLIVLALFAQSWVIEKVYNWFIVSVYNVNKISFNEAIALSVVIGVLRAKYKKSELSWENYGEYIQAYTTVILSNLLFVFISWLFYLILF